MLWVSNGETKNSLNNSPYIAYIRDVVANQLKSLAVAPEAQIQTQL